MCGRYVSTRSPNDLVDLFEVTCWNPEQLLEPSWNIAPTNDVWALLQRPERETGACHLVCLQPLDRVQRHDPGLSGRQFCDGPADPPVFVAGHHVVGNFRSDGLRIHAFQTQLLNAWPTPPLPEPVDQTTEQICALLHL
jgi:hypothetical protein